jgi:DNA-binding FrmR family transcriptional regulator
MPKYNEKIALNFKKAASHLAKVAKMLESGEYCVDIMQQNLAVMGLLKSAHQQLLEGHLNSCFMNAMKTANDSRKQQMIDEILKVSRYADK